LEYIEANTLGDVNSVNNYKQNVWLILAFFLVAVNLRPAISSIAPLLETIRSDLDMSSFAVSFLTTIPVLCMGIFAPFSARVGARWGIERSIAICLIIIGFMTFMRAWTYSWFFLLLTTFFIGVAIAIVGVLLSGFIKRNFPRHTASMMGVYSVGLAIGSSLSAGFTIPIQGLLRGSWSSALGMWSVLAVLALLFWWPVALKGTKNIKAETTSQGEGKIPWKNKRAWLFTIIFGLQAALFYSVITWLAPIAEEMGMTKVYAGIAVTVFTLVQMLGGVTIPIAINYFNHSRKLWLIGCSVITLIGLVFLIFSDVINLWVSIAFLGIGLGGLLPLSMMLPLDEASTPNDASAWTALVLTGGYIFAGCIPPLIGRIHDMTNDYQTSYIGLVIICLFLIVCSFGTKSNKKSVHEFKPDRNNRNI
jgi:CP family cyanate transporter-like MFS transporter